MTKSVSVVIPNYNGVLLLQKNLPSLVAAAGNVVNNIIEIIVVDDGSKDDSVGFLKQNYPHIRVFKFTRNRGFAASVNMGVRMAKGNLVVLLNTDVAPQEDFLISTFHHFDNHKVFAVSFHEQDFSWARGVFVRGFISHEPGLGTDSAHISFWASGGSAIYRRELWVELGGMDEKLLSPFYWEDIDLSYRAWKRGYSVIWEPKAVVVHHHESTIAQLPSKFTQRVKERNQLLFIWKNLTSRNLFKKHVSGLWERAFRHPGYFLIILLALSRLGQVLKKRQKERRESEISDEAVFAKFS